jgi:hypothetical protein
MTVRPGSEVERIISICRRNETGLPGVKTLEAKRQNLGDLFNSLTSGSRISPGWQCHPATVWPARVHQQAPNWRRTAPVGASIEDEVKPTRKLSRKAPFKLAQDNVEPRGDKDSMDAAKQCLGPFVGGKFGSSPAEDEEYAEQKIFEIARSYNWHRLLNAQSPRSNVVKNSLDQVIESTAAAFRALRGMDDHTRLMFEFCASEPSTAGLHAEANGIALPLSSFDGRPDRESPWLLQLQGLHRLALKQRELIERAAGEDKGGRSSLYKDLYISPDYQLIEQGWHVFELFKPGRAQGSVNNEFLNFIQYIYTFATKKGANETGAPTFLKKIKQMIGHLRKLSDAREKYAAAQRLSAEIEQGNLDQESVDRFSAMTDELERLAVGLPDVARALRQSTSKKPRG